MPPAARHVIAGNPPGIQMPGGHPGRGAGRHQVRQVAAHRGPDRPGIGGGVALDAWHNSGTNPRTDAYRGDQRGPSLAVGHRAHPQHLL
ncbi:MAG: hypothetical protein JO309_09820 [Pseudonocardiales bacterium]|nr:hypothetical protein [Pseudonocardiales bacterium]